MKSFSTILIFLFRVINLTNFFSQFQNDVQDSGVTCLINNAGVAPKATRYNLVKVEQMESTFRTNVIAPLFLTKVMIPLLKKNSQSLIVNMSSILGSIENNQKVSSGGAGGGQYPYRSTKAALNMVTRSLRYFMKFFFHELKKNNEYKNFFFVKFNRCYFSIDLEHAKIGAIAIHPGWVQTDMGGKYASLTPEESIKGVLNVITNYNSEQHNGQFLDFNGESVSW